MTLLYAVLGLIIMTGVAMITLDSSSIALCMEC